jgi:D-amino-acid dehydrogenase
LLPHREDSAQGPDAHRLEEYGVDYTVLTGAQLRELEPHLSEMLVGAIHFRGSPTSSDPGMLTKAYVSRRAIRRPPTG